MNIVLCTDKNYVMPCGITMISILENNKSTPVTFHIIGMDLDKESEEILTSVLAKYKGASISFYEIRQEFLESYNFSLYGAKHMSIASYARLFLANLLPENIDKVLYMDCDIIVNKDLSEFWNVDITNYSVAGVPDLYAMFSAKVIEKIGYKETFQYINAGIILINLKYWREQNLINTFIDFYNEKHDIITFYDQDIINGTLYDTKLLLPMKFNVIDFYYTLKPKDLHQYKSEVDEAIKDPVIIHYTSPEKPWLKICMHPLRKEFLKYKDLSYWKNTPQTWGKTTLSKRIQYYKRLFLYVLNLKKPKYLKLKSVSKEGTYNFKY